MTSSFIRNAAKRALRGVVYRRRLPREFGGAEIFVSPESQLKYLRPGAAGFDPMLLRLAKEFVRTGLSVWDIGANVGVFSFAAAGLGARLLAVEPDPFLANLLMRSRALQANSRFDVRVAACAVAAAPSMAKLVISAAGRAGNSLARYAAGRGEYGVSVNEVFVPTVLLDSLLSVADAPQVIKVDVEGAELEVFDGARHILETIRPVWIFECGGTHWQTAAALLRRHGYRLYDADCANRQEITTPAFNTLAMPPP